MKRIVVILAVVLGFASVSAAEEIGYIEDFSLAEDREVPLKQLIPGTEDFYYYHCLHYQNTEQFVKVDEMLAMWIKRHGYTSRVNEIRNRQALLTYPKDPQKALEFIRQQLGIQFNHQRETLGFQPNLPTALEPKSISRETLTQVAMGRYQNLDGFENPALDWLVASDLNPDQRRHLLQRLTRPDYANLVDLILADLDYKNSSGFGAMNIHRQLLKSQLDELLEKKPELLNQAHFVNTYLSKLWPANDVDWRHDVEARRAYLDRLWSFVQKLAPVHNSLKAHVVYHRLVLDRSQGVYDKDRFITYIRLPRHVSYIDSEFMKRETSQKHAANLNADFRNVTMLPPVGDDEPLVRSYLHHFFVTETTYEPYEEFINDLYLKYNFAETKIVNGLGEPEQWYSMLPPAQYQELKERIDLDFAYTNKEHFAAGEPVSLDLNVKNVKSLIVKVFRINTNNFYRDNLQEIDTDVTLDGLVANQENTHTYSEPPLRRVERHFEFPTLSEPGVYVIDFIGNGKSSRALIRKGKLRHLVRTTTAGQEFTILDEKNQRVSGATLWLSGTEYKPDEDGTITVPFSNQPGRQPIVLTDGEFTSLDHFQHESENYSLVAGIYVDRESLLKRKKAQVIVRPGLFLNGTPVSLSVLEKVRLVVSSTDRDGVSTSKEVSGFELFEDRESTFEFQTPQRLASIAFTLNAKVENLSQEKKVDLSASQNFQLNEIDRTEKIEDLHLLQVGGNYFIDVLGKTGETKPDRPVQFAIKHRDFKHPVNVSLQTDKQGRIALGELPDIEWVNVTGPEGTSHRWTLTDDRRTYHQAVHGKAGETISLPLMSRSEQPQRSKISLLELRDGGFVADRFDALSVEDGFLQINGLPRGDYNLLLKASGTQITLRVSEGEVRDGYVLSENRQLEVRGSNPLQLDDIQVGDEQITLQLSNATKFTRVHVFATRYEPAYSAFGNLARVTDAEPYTVINTKTECAYVAGRNIGDEYRYIIDRKYANKFPGVMLERPSLLLNPWAIRSTETGVQHAAEGEEFYGVGAQQGGQAGRPAKTPSPVGQLGDFANLDFLSEPTAVMVNAEPDENGAIAIERNLLGNKQYVHVVAVDPVSTVYRNVSLAEPEVSMQDLRLTNALDPDSHFTQQKQISVVKDEGEFVLQDIATSRFEAYDSLQRVYATYVTLSGDSKLVEFSFILGWDNLEPKEKRTLYSEHACHELSFFLFKKDPQFFEEVIKPYLHNKKDKTFLDHWLLGNDLSDYRKPWNYGQLNIVERILLAQRIQDEQQYTSRHVQELYDLLPPDIEKFNRLFATAIKGSALDTDDAFGFEEAQDAERLKDLLQRQAGRGGEAKRDAAEAMESPVMPPGQDFAPADEPAAPKLAAKPEAEALAKKQAEEDRARRALGEKAADGEYYFRDEADKRKEVRQLYRKLDKTKEWVENNYYKLPIEQQNANLVTVNTFWRDYAHHTPGQPFYSVNFAEASRNFTEMMFALSMLDLPFTGGAHESEFDNAKMTITAAGPIVVFHEEIKPAEGDVRVTHVLISQNFFRHGDRYYYEHNERFDKFVRDEFLVHTVYGCQVVVTNPTSSRKKLDVLVQVPEGSLPVLGSQYTRSLHIDLQPYNTQTLEYYFYFPESGKYPHYPVHAAKNETLLAFAEKFEFNVVEEPSKIDRTSWDYISQHGSSEDVIAYLKANNLQRTNLDKIAFRMQDKKFFETVTQLLAERHAYNHTLWSYGIKHDVPSAARQYLQHSDGFVQSCGQYIDSPLLTIDAVARKSYQHMEYKPLVNARAHQLGRRRQILNDRFFDQYHSTLKVLSYHRQLDDEALMAMVYYMLLQDRVAEALDLFQRVDAENLATQLQHDYFSAYLAMYQEDTGAARSIAAKYKDYPVDRWRNAFVAVTTQLDEIDGANVEVVDEEDRGQQQTQLAATQPSFEFTVESKQVTINYQNLEKIQVNYYLMDIELLFSRNPFVQQYSEQFSYIIPNAQQTVDLPADKKSTTFALPDELHNQNVLVEISGNGVTKSQAYYSNSLAVQVIESYGQLRVTDAKTDKPIPTTYVKVYARMQDGKVQFYKDGYTDLRGRFDFTSLNTNELDFVDRFALLIMSEDHGAVVREASPPKR